MFFCEYIFEHDKGIEVESTNENYQQIRMSSDQNTQIFIFHSHFQASTRTGSHHTHVYLYGVRHIHGIIPIDGMSIADVNGTIWSPDATRLTFNLFLVPVT